MKKSLFSIFAAASLVWGLGACSSSSTETTTTDATAETVTTNDPESATRAGEVGVANEMNRNAAEADIAAATTLDTASFAMVAASSDMFETLSSEMALQRGMHAEVKKFAQQMLTDHGNTTAELKAIASRKNMTLPTGPLPMHQRMLVPLHDATEGKKFDERYMEAQVKAHAQAVSLFESASKNERDADLKAFAAKNLPALRMHLDMAKKTKDLVD